MSLFVTDLAILKKLQNLRAKGKTKNMEKKMSNIKQEGQFTLVNRDDGKIVVASDMVYDHIGTHGSLGKGSVFSGGITPAMINEFLVGADIPKGGGGIPANFPGGGYLLVAPFESAMKLQDAEMREGSKEDFSKEAGGMVPVPVAEVHTSQPIEDFKTDETTVLVFPYDPSRSAPEQNAFVDEDPILSEALKAGNLYALATAFPGGFQVEGQTVPKATEWGGVTDPKWAVIIPSSQTDSLMENWNRLAGLLAE